MSVNATTLPLEDRLLARPPLRQRIGNRERLRLRPEVLVRLELGTIVLCSLVVVLAAAGHPSFLSAPTRPNYFPGWMAGPLGGLLGSIGSSALKAIFSGALALSFAGYVLLVVRHSRALSLGVVVTAIVAVHAILFMAPPLTLTDVFNYLNYARMDVVHHLNPYVTIPVLEPHGDPSYALSNWHGLLSPYGPLFTIFTFGLARLSPAAYLWTFKCTLMLAEAGILVLTWRCARLLGRDPLQAIVIVGLNPIVLFWGLGADHNDFFPVFFVVLGIYLMLLAAKRGERSRTAPGRAGSPHAGAARPERDATPPLERVRLWLLCHHALDAAAGASFVVAAGMKASAGVMVPIALASLVGRTGRLVSLAVGAAVAGAVVGAASLLAFGAHFPDIAIQNALVTGFSLPNLFGLALGQGGETTTLHNLVNLALVAAIALACAYAWRRREALTPAGWATLAIIVTLSWALPWYLLWVLPMAALAGSRRLRNATLILGAFLIFVWAPLGVQLLSDAGVHPQRTALGRQHVRAVQELLRP